MGDGVDYGINREDPNNFNKNTQLCGIIYDFLRCSTQLDDGNFARTRRVMLLLFLRLEEKHDWRELAETFNISYSLLWKEIDILVQLGYAEKTEKASAYDQRKVTVQLTDLGHDRIELWLEGRVP